MRQGFVYAVLAAFLIVCGGNGSAQAQAVSGLSNEGSALFNANAKAPDINTIPVLRKIVESGGKLYYLGERSGLNGWFIVKGGQVQMIYLSPDRKTALVGGMFTDQGDNVTGVQIKELSSREKAIYELLYGTGQRQNQILAAGSVEGGVTALASDATAAPAPDPNSSGIPAVSLSPGDRLYQDLEAAAGVTLGKPEAPEILIIVAPKCPNCKGTWRELRDAVKAGQARVRLIPVYNSTGGEEAEEAAQLLRAKDPLEAWDKYVEGDKSAMGDKPDETAIKAVVANLKIVSKWNIKGYPYLVYRNKEGKIKIVQGRPERMAPVLVDLGK